MQHEPGSNWNQLGEPARNVVESLIDQVRRQGGALVHPYGSGEAFAYPRQDGSIMWGVNGAHGNILRGVVRFNHAT